MRRTLLACLALVLGFAVTAAPSFAQGVQSSTLTGSVTSSDGAPLPGVTVTITSPSLIGERATVTGVNGDYVFKNVPPGNYTVSFGLEGMKTVERTASLPLGGTARSDASMEVTAAEETIVVTGEAPSALETTTVGANFGKETIDNLPVNRTPLAIADLAPGLTNNTEVAGGITINGAMGYDNSILVNGINVQDPIFGRSDNLFIEDAIEETQVLTSGISAEYGGFTGGVVNAITKSGGNQFSGTLPRRLQPRRVARRDAVRERPRHRARGRPQQDLQRHARRPDPPRPPLVLPRRTRPGRSRDAAHAPHLGRHVRHGLDQRALRGQAHRRRHLEPQPPGVATSTTTARTSTNQQLNPIEFASIDPERPVPERGLAGQLQRRLHQQPVRRAALLREGLPVQGPGRIRHRPGERLAVLRLRLHHRRLRPLERAVLRRHRPRRSRQRGVVRRDVVLPLHRLDGQPRLQGRRTRTSRLRGPAATARARPTTSSTPTRCSTRTATSSSERTAAPCRCGSRA